MTIRCATGVPEEELSEHDREELRKFKHLLSIHAAKREAPAEGRFALDALEQALYPEGL